ncbi:energy transducer TonB [Mangrovimonas sp. ST2L15]|uniref:energy transducer TonB family protein n=1 Tax=Mangrovimonas sp. ST2L15 TaxID=1645916 RepID=UPI0006B5D4DA|nr:energy transducer TonB [Mangrovimonas sp. ST2L15]
MNLSDKHKAILITALISGTVLLTVFNMHLKRQKEVLAESYYEMEPQEMLEELKKLEELEAEAEDNAANSTNKAINETSTYKRFAQAYQPIEPPQDYELKNTETTEVSEEPMEDSSADSDAGIDEETMSSFNEVNALLKKQRSSAAPGEQSVNKNTTIRYSLKDRTHEHLPIPIYLCEDGGKVVINITVNEQGMVTKANVNGSTTSSNECLEESALEYAKKARFNPDRAKKTQLGTITFLFKSKH